MSALKTSLVVGAMAVATVLLAIVIFLAVASVIALPVWFAWNLAMPSVFGLPTIGFIQAVALVIVFRLLIGMASSSNK